MALCAAPIIFASQSEALPSFSEVHEFQEVLRNRLRYLALSLHSFYQLPGKVHKYLHGNDVSPRTHRQFEGA